MANPVLLNEKPVRTLSEFDFLHDPNDKNSKLGVGSFASVKLAKEKKTGKSYALKMISVHPSKATNSDLHNIRTEITIHRKLNHSNIIKFYDYIQKDYYVYLILDRADNGNLYSYIHKKRSLSQEEIFRFFYQTCLAVQYLHQNDILHRDLKPENLLLDKDFNIKLCDFGWSARRITEKRTTFCGTYEYMAPEIVYKKTYDYRVDIWSLGVLLYELIHKEAPYKGRSLPEISKSLAKPHITFSSSIHPDAKDLIQKILKTNPSERLPINQILLHPWVRHSLSKNSGLQPSGYDILSQEIRPAHSQNMNVEALKSQPKQDQENVESEIPTIVDHRFLNDTSNYISKKASNSYLFNTSNEAGNFREKESGKSINVSCESYPLSQPDILKRKPLQDFLSNIPLKKTSGNLTTRGHTKSSSSVTASMLEKLVFDERKSPSNHYKNNKISSPTFKTKVDNFLYHLSSQTTTHKATRDLSEFVNTKALTQQTARGDQNTIPSTYRYYNGLQNNLTQNFETEILTRAKYDLKSEDNAQFSTSSSSTSSSRPRSELESGKRGYTSNYAKNNLQINVNLPRGDDAVTLPSPLSNMNRSVRPKVDTKRTEPIMEQFNPLNLPQKFNHLTPKTSFNANLENILNPTISNRYKSRESQEIGFSFNVSYKGLDYKKKTGYKFNEGLHFDNQKFFASTERGANPKEIKRDLVREKENQFIFKEEHGRNWAL